MNRSYVQPRFRCTGQGFIVLAQPATTSQPRQCSLNHPPAWQHLKLMAGPGTLDDLQDPARHGHHPVHQLAAVASVSPDESQAWESSYQFIDDQPRPISVLDIGRMHHHRQQQAHGIYDDVSLSTVDLLTSIIATRPPFSVVFTLWLSMIAALGVGFLPSASRTQGRSVSLTRSHVPPMVQLRKYLYRVCQGGRSCGTIRQGHPLRSKYRMPFTTSRRSTVRGRPPGLAGGSRGRGSPTVRPSGRWGTICGSFIKFSTSARLCKHPLRDSRLPLAAMTRTPVGRTSIGPCIPLSASRRRLAAPARTRSASRCQPL